MIRIVPLILLGLTGCTTSSLRTEIIPSALYNVSEYKTYAWDRQPLTLIGILTGANNDQLEARVLDAVGQGLVQRGYQLVDHEVPHDPSPSSRLR